MKDIPINPDLPDDFDCTPNDERSPEQLAEWWRRPFIRTCTWEEMQVDKDYEQWRERVLSIRPDLITDLEPKDAWEAMQEQLKAKWFKSWPSGTRYDVRCLDGGAWDRSTGWGMFATLEEAIKCARHEAPDYAAMMANYPVLE